MNQIHHVGYAVENISTAIEKFLGLGYKIYSNICQDIMRDVEIVFLMHDNYRIELVAPLSQKATVKNVLKKNGAIPYHICYEVESMKKAVTDLTKQSYLQISDISPAPAIENCLVCFLYHSVVGMVELLEIRR